MRVRYGMGLAAAITLGGGCLQALNYEEATLDPSCCAGGAGGTAVTTTSAGDGGAGGVDVCKPGEITSCYSGDMMTLKVGVCKSGEQICSPTGKDHGACIGEVVPTNEDCSKPQDEDCDGFACSQTIWAKQFGDTSFQDARTLAVDKKNGDVYVAGYFYGALQFGNDVLIDTGNGDALIAKFDTDGKYLWSKQFGDDQLQIIVGMVVDTAQNVIVVAQGDLGGGNVKKLDMNGNVVWTVPCAVSLNSQALQGVTVDSQDNVTVAGDFSSPTSCNGVPLTSIGGADVVVAKLAAADGAVKWAKTFGDKADQRAVAVASDSNDNIYLAGQYSGLFSFSPTVSLVEFGGGDAYVAKLNSSGVGTWAKELGDSNGQSAYGLAVDALGAPIIVGAYQGTISLSGAGSITNPSAVDYNSFIAKLDSGGLGVWLKDMPKLGVPEVATDGAKDVLIATSDFGVSKLAGSTGIVLWSRVFGIANNIGGVAAGKRNEAFVGGSFKGALTFDSFPLATTPQNNTDIFLAKIAP